MPMFIGIAAIPLLIDGMGLERFGMLSIAWMLVGYFGLLDMGLGRALTQKIADRIGGGNVANLKPLIWKALGLVGLFGLLGCLALSLMANWLVYDLFNISAIYQQETVLGIYWLAITIPFVIVSTGLLGILEGQQYFGWTAIVRAPLGILMFLAPLITLQWTTSLEWVLASLFIVRVTAWIALMVITTYTLRNYPGWKTDMGELKSLFVFGGWITVSNIISPMMVYFDRFYIAAVLSVAVVAFYTTPFDLLTKALIVPFALVGVMFASFATDWQQDKLKVVKQFKLSILAVIVVMVPFSLITFFFAKFGMTLWLGEDFALQSYEIVQWLSVGILLNAIAMVPFALIQAAGRADITAKLHLIELPFYALLLWLLVAEYGLIGAAMAWVFRVALDALVLMVIAVKELNFGIAKQRQIFQE
ncbi:MAG: flippase [Thiomicrospira sp.]|nr:flippase [Thiomicrospira sp.]NCO14976.1 flippase [Thiomicrospira sp.]NCO82628.1 flippase [Thiomicrospira sp.]